MSLKKIFYPNQQTIVGLWKIEEEVEELLHLLPLSTSYHPHYTAISHSKRQKEWLSVRCLLQELLASADIEIEYDEYGKPLLVDQGYQLSIAHIDDWCSVILHPKQKVSIDLEIVAPRLGRLQSKFISSQELELLGNDLRTLAMIWSAKESMYKYYGKRGLDFKRDMQVISIKGNNRGIIKMQFKQSSTFDIYFQLIEEQAFITYMISK